MWGQGILIRLFMGGCFRRGGFRGWMGEVWGGGSGGVIFYIWLYLCKCMYVWFILFIVWMDGYRK